MEFTQNNYIEILKKKLEILNDMLVLTEAADFFDDNITTEQHTENYHALYKKRAPLLKQAKQLDVLINSTEYKELIAELKDERFAKDCALLNAKIKDTVGKLLGLDEKNKNAAEGFMSIVKNNIRDIKRGRNVSTLYQTDVVAQGGIYFDTKK